MHIEEFIREELEKNGKIANTILFGMAKGKRQMGRLRYKWKVNIKNNLKIISWVYGLGSFDGGQGPVASCCEHGSGPFGSVKCR